MEIGDESVDHLELEAGVDEGVGPGGAGRDAAAVPPGRVLERAGRGGAAGNHAAAFAAGAVDSTGAIADFSSRGASACGGGIFPELVAPGVNVLTSSLSLGGVPQYTYVSGTSYAAPHVAAVAALGSSPNVTVVAPDKGIGTLQQLVAAAKTKPGGLSFATAGVGSATHLSTERLRLSAGFEALHVPFRGMPEALTEVMTGRVDFSCSSISAALPFIQDGKLIALAVTTPQRSSVLPNVPT